MGVSEAGQAARATAEAREVAAPLGDAVTFHEGWVPYEQRANWLLDADCAISTHREHLETRFAFRTRLLDCVWAGLPIVCTEGDELAERVRRDGLGAAAAAGDVEATAAALDAVLERGRDAYGPALAQARGELAWERAGTPLLRWAGESREPRRVRGGSVARRARDAGFRATLRATGRRWWPSL
jgi:glycosyltransferase involved in cell wall biosynthesis